MNRMVSAPEPKLSGMPTPRTNIRAPNISRDSGAIGMSARLPWKVNRIGLSWNGSTKVTFRISTNRMTARMLNVMVTNQPSGVVGMRDWRAPRALAPTLLFGILNLTIVAEGLDVLDEAAGALEDNQQAAQRDHELDRPVGDLPFGLRDVELVTQGEP